MTVRGLQAVPQSDDDLGLEPRHPPVSVWLGGTVLVMNVLSVVLSLMA